MLHWPSIFSNGRGRRRDAAGALRRGFVVAASVAILLWPAALLAEAEIQGAVGTCTSWLNPACWIPLIIGSIASVIVWVLGQLIAVIVYLIVWISTYNGFIAAAPVAQGWNIIRDISNMFFVLLMLIISFGTILHVDQYQMKRLLPKVLLMAVLVNFSKAIAGLFIDFSQVIMLTFVAAYQQLGSGNLLKALKMDNILYVKPASSGLGSFAIAGAYLLAIVYALVAFVVTLAVLLIFVVRIVMLWLLVVFSPLAYVLSVIPAGQQYASQWWDMFSKYVIIGPVLAFFLWLSFSTLPNITSGPLDPRAAVEQAQAEPGQKLTADAPAELGATDVKAGSAEQLIGFVISIAMLIMSLVFAQQVGGAVGKIAGTAYDKAVKGTYKPFTGLATWGERKFFSATGVGLNPARAIRAWRGYSQRRIAEDEAIGQWRAGSAASKRFGKGQGRRGMVRLALGAHEDAFQTYLGYHGLKRLGRTLVRPRMGVDDFVEAQKQNQIRKVRMAMYEADRSGKPLRAAGAEALRKDIREQRLAERAGEVSRERERTDLPGRDNPRNFRNGVYIDDALAGAGLPIGPHAPMTEERRQFLEQWDKDLVQADLAMPEARADFELGVEAELAGTPDAEQEARGRRELAAQLEKDQAKLKNLQRGGLNDDQRAARDDEFLKVIQQLKRIDQDIRRAERGERTLSGGQLNELQAQKALLTTRLGEDRFKRLDENGNERSFSRDPREYANLDEYEEAARQEMAADNYRVTEDEKKANLALNEKLINKMEENLARQEGELLDENDPEDKAEIEKAKREAAAADRRRQRYEVAPRPYYAERGYRILEQQELGKLPKESMEYEEIDSLLRQAVSDKDIVRISSLMKKAAKDANDNEYLNSFGYGSGPKGTEEFRRDILEPIMGEQASMSLMNDIAYINEDIGHRNTSRMYGVQNGIFYQKTPEEQAASAAWEVLKAGSRNFLQNSNRLAYGYEDAEGRFHLDLTGKLIIAGLQDDMVKRLNANEFNPNLLLKLGEDIQSLRDMVNKGVLKQEVLNLIQSRFESLHVKGVPSTHGGFEKLASRLAA